MSDLPSTWFPVHPTTHGPPNHSGEIWVNRKFSYDHVGEIGTCQLVRICFKVFTFERRQYSLGAIGILMLPTLGLDIDDLDQLAVEATP